MFGQHSNPVAMDKIETAVSFWQKPWAQNLLPFATSLSFHAAVIGTAALTALAVKVVTDKGFHPPETISVVPDVRMVPDKTGLGGPVNPGTGDDFTRRMQQDIDPTVPADSLGTFDRRGNGVLTAGISGESDLAESLLAVGLQDSIRRTAARGPGSGPNRPGGEIAPFGIPGGGERVALRSKFMGPDNGGDYQGVTSVAYVCDASGSMLGQQFDLLRAEIQKDVDGLTPANSFDVIFFQNDSATSLSAATHSRTLLMATAENKKKTAEFLHQASTVAGTNPIPALRQAIREKPQLIYLLTDGAFDNPSNDQVLAEVRKLNADKKVRINTIAFYRKDASDAERKLCDAVLSTIARENGGTFRAVSTMDLLGR